MTGTVNARCPGHQPAQAPAQGELHEGAEDGFARDPRGPAACRRDLYNAIYGVAEYGGAAFPATIRREITGIMKG